MDIDKEIVIGLVAPIGVDLDNIQEKLRILFENNSYHVEEIELSSLLKNNTPDNTSEREISEPNHRSLFRKKINYCNEVRKQYGNHSLTQIVFRELKKLRDKNENNEKNIVFLVRQLKRPEEVLFMRDTLGRAFFCLGINAPKEIRRENLERKIKQQSYIVLEQVLIEREAAELIAIDQYETNDYGQCIQDTFPLCDYFLNVNNNLDIYLNHFYKIIFHDSTNHPFPEETYMAMAYITALRSSSLMRQVGALIVDENDMIVSTGYNEIPKTGGGFEDHTTSPHKDNYNHKINSNNVIKEENIMELLKFIFKDDEYTEKDINTKYDEIKNNKSLAINNTIEFHKDLHAENGAIIQSARFGRSTKNCTMYVTTFPCHLCTKNIIGAGIKKVIYIEPYPKSKAKDLFDTNIMIHSSNPPTNIIHFEPYSGIAPRHYLEAFDNFKLIWDENNYVKINDLPIDNKKIKNIKFIRDSSGYLERQQKAIDELEEESNGNPPYRE